MLDFGEATRRVRELSERFGLAVEPDGPHRGHHRRPAAAGRDPEGALPRRGHPDPRRADRRADPPGGEGAVRDHPQPAGPGEVDRLHQPQAARGARGRRPDHRPAPGQEDRHRAGRGCDRGEPGPDDGRARGAAPGREASREAGRHAPRRRGPPRLRRPRRSRRSRASRFACGRARSSASPASTGTARPS